MLGNRRIAAVATFTAGLLAGAARAQQDAASPHDMHDMAGMHDMPGMTMEMPAGILGIPASREGSGTSWLPDASPMRALHFSAGGWSLMFHANAFAYLLETEDRRGDRDVGSVNWGMLMARRTLGPGELGLRAMLSLEPATIPECGYPVLLASGESCEGGRPLHDHQHPHDFFMELAGTYRLPLGDDLGAEGYAAFAGEPALGPTAFPHRLSALANPVAPIAHHWLDSTHIAFGVATAGIFGRRWKVEGSAFNGREPDENRWDLDLAALDSYSGRVWWLPDERWALQVSAGHLTDAEPGRDGEPAADVDRATASATFHLPLADARVWATTAAWGRNREHGDATDAWLLESNLELPAGHGVFGRVERVEKTGHDLALPAPRLDEEVFAVAALTVGYTHEWATASAWRLGAGASLTVNRVPAELERFYGDTHPLGWGIFASVRPAAMPAGH